MRNNDNCEFGGDPLLDCILDMSDYTSKSETVMIADPTKQKALSASHDILEAIVRNTGAKEPVDVQYHYSARCATVIAEIPGLYLNAPWALAVALVEASNIQILPTGHGTIRISLYFSNYFKSVG